MAPATDQAGRIETHGIDYVPDSERHGSARSLFVVWAASNVTYLYIVLGGTLVLLGLDVWQALAVVVAGNLFWGLVGWLSISGPSSGTPSEVVTRAMFGVRGNRVFNVVLGWLVGVAYEAINLSIGALAGFALIAQWGGNAGTPVKVLVVLATALVTFTISVYGHATIVKLSGWFTWILLACTLVLGYDVLRHAHWGYQVPAASAVHGGALWGVAAAGFTIIASSPLSWGTGADYARYLPADVSRRGVIWWTALGGFLPAVTLSGLGVLAGTVVDMTNPQTSLRVLLPGWFYPVFLLVIVAGAITNNVLTAYSTGLALQAVGIPWQRSVTVIFDAVVAIRHHLLRAVHLRLPQHAEQHPRADGGVSRAGARDLRHRHPAQAQPLQRARPARRDAGQPVLVLARGEPGRGDRHDRRHRGGAAVRQHQRAGGAGGAGA